MSVRLVVLFSLLFRFAAGEVTVLASVDQNRLGLNETLTLKVTAEESNDFPKLDIRSVKDFTVISGPGQSSSFQWINGKMSSSKTLSWTLIPNRPGELMIPPLSVEVDGKLIETGSIPITVTQGGRPAAPRAEDQPAKDQAQSPLLFLAGEVDKEEAFQGEQVTVHYKLYTRVNLRQYSVERKPKGVGFWQEELYAPKQPTLKETSINGVRYRVATLYKVALFPTSHGELTLDPMILNCSIEVPARNRPLSLFDDFFSDPFFSRTKQQIVRSDGLTIRVKPVPELGRPADYTGAVGEFRLSSRVDTTRVTANQALAFTVNLSGTGNLGLFQLPELDFPGGLEVFSPKTSMDKDPFRDEISGKRTWEYILIPRRDGQYLLPSVELSYLEPESGRWRSTATDPIPILVEPGKSSADGNQGLTKEEIALLSQDIRYIRQEAVHMRNISARMVPPAFWLFNLLAVTFFFTPNVVDYVKSNQNNRQGVARSRSALRRAKKVLSKVESDDFESVEQSVFDYFSDRMGVASAGLDARILKERLRNLINTSSADDLTNILEICDRARFAPSAVDASAPEIAQRTTALLREIEAQL